MTVGLGILAMCTFWPSIVWFAVGVVRSIGGSRRDQESAGR